LGLQLELVRLTFHAPSNDPAMATGVTTGEQASIDANRTRLILIFEFSHPTLFSATGKLLLQRKTGKINFKVHF